MILVSDVLVILVDLGIDGDLEGESGGQTSMTLLKDSDTVCHNTDGLIGLGVFGGCLWGLTLGASSIEEMNDESKRELRSH